MNHNTKSSITLPIPELRLVESLRRKLKAKSKVEVVRRGLKLLQEQTDRQSLRQAYLEASEASRSTLPTELNELDSLTGEGLSDE